MTAKKGIETKQVVNESEYHLNIHSQVAGTGFSGNRVLRQLVVGFALWIISFGLLYALTADFAFWKTLSLFFTQAALVTFGGAYAVLPYVTQVSVEKLQWLSNLQMIDGLALGETTPGPLIMVLAFVGFMAGYNHFGGSIAMATLGLGITTFYTFLPCFLFILVGAPIIERTQHNPTIKSILSIVTAAVTGVILNLTVYFGRAVVFTEPGNHVHIDEFSFAWIIVSLLAMSRFKVGMIAWIGLSALAGLGYYWLTVGIVRST